MPVTSSRECPDLSQRVIGKGTLYTSFVVYACGCIEKV